jgi:hypothetical protein
MPVFHAWESFYITVGSASAGLIGLMFVVTTLTGGYERSKAMRGARLYLTPVVFNFATAFSMSAVALAPAPVIAFQAMLLALVGVVGVGNMVWVAVGIRTGETPHWSDFWCYGAAPAVIYALLIWVSMGIWGGQTWAFWAMAGLSLALLLLSIRNAWDLVTWMTPHREDGEETSPAIPTPSADPPS